MAPRNGKSLGKRCGTWSWSCLVLVTMLLSCSNEPDPCLPADLAGRNVIVIVIDALRMDHLGCYGYGRDTSPFIDRLAGEGIVIEGALANSSLTRESISALLTGRFPSRASVEGWRSRPASELITLGELYGDLGYRTGFFSNTPVLRDPLFAQGFEESEIIGKRWDQSGEGKRLSERAAEFARRHAAEPFMMYLHYLDPHGPYQPADAFYHRFSPTRFPHPVGLYSKVRRTCHTLIEHGFGPGEPRFEDLVLRYDAEIAAVDAAVERLFDALREAGVLEKTLVIIMADHGEEFLEHDYVEHAWTLYNESLRVPLIFWTPGAQPARVTAQVSVVDIVPTLLELSSIPHPDQELDGKSIFSRGRRGFAPASDHSSYLAELRIKRRNVLRTMIRGRWKYIAAWRWLEPRERPSVLAKDYQPPPVSVWGPPVREWLYDLGLDPAENDDLSAQQPEVMASFRAEMEAYRRTVLEAGEDQPVDDELSPEDEEALRALGYLN